MIRILFVCLGNICRSPMAHGVFRQMVREAGLQDHFEIDSAATGSWHLGERPHRGTRRVLSRHGIDYDHRARQVSSGELDDWDYLIAMDAANLRSLRGMLDGFQGEIRLLLDYAPDLVGVDIPDPYYNDRFEEVYQLVTKGCQGLLDHIRQKEAL